MSNLPKPSDEQLNIITKLEKYNIIVDSVAGSGKTTTNLHIANKYKDLNILLLTYNAKLRIETKTKCAKYKLNNIEVHTYHSFGKKYYNDKCHIDSVLDLIVNEDTDINTNIQYDIIILDEAQDINLLYYKFIRKIYRDNAKKAKLCLLGDKFQSIFIYNGSDNRYMIHGNKVFDLNDYEWLECKLSQSFRITNEMSEFINNCMLSKERIYSSKYSYIKPQYIIANIFGKKPYEVLVSYFEKGYKPEDIFILAPSVKTAPNTPIRKLENKVKQNYPNINIYIPISDEEKLDAELLQNKLVISTFHQVKGLERKVVLVFNFDESYFNYYAKNENRYTCPNILYVATTRASEELVLFHDVKNNFLPFLDNHLLKDYTQFSKSRTYKIKSAIQRKTKNYSVTNLIKHLPYNVLKNCKKYFEYQNYNLKSTNIILESKVYNKVQNTYESVGELNGLIIPMLYEYFTTKKLQLYDKILDLKINTSFGKNKILLDFYDDLLNDCNNELLKDKLSIKTLLKLCNLWNAYSTEYLFKLCQINDYNWLTQNNIKECLKNFKKLNLSNDLHYEVKYEDDIILENGEKYNISGYADCIDKHNNILYEFKCISELKDEHFIQLAIYMYLDLAKGIKNRKYILYNILTNEYIELISNYSKLLEMIKYIITSKTSSYKIDDITFFNNLKYNEPAKKIINYEEYNYECDEYILEF